MRNLAFAGYAVIFGAMAALQLWGLAKRRTATMGELVGVMVRSPAVRWLLIAAWLWWGWHGFVRVTL